MTNKIFNETIRNSNSETAIFNPLIQNQGEIDSKIALIKAKVLETICRNMPISTLFIPELKIDLGVFIKDQILIHKIANILTSFNEKDLNRDSIIALFKNSDLFSEVQGMFKQDPEPYLTLLCDACVDVLLNQKKVPNHLKLAIEGRIFTLKNALIAQHTPQAILNSQKQNNISPQNIENIIKEGASFIRESLEIHLNALKNETKIPFREFLTSTCKQLIPFVQKITRIYMRENGKICPDNPLTFRNPTGYNYHGMIAATIMGACLNALGYKTQLMGRCDLEPRVTLATVHNILEVTASDETKYIVDPSFIQFHKDICITDDLLPKEDVLVLKEDEVDQYIENYFMGKWKEHFNQIQAGDSSILEKLQKKDQHLSFIIDRVGLPEILVPKNPESWARKSFNRIWDLSSYLPINSDQTFQEIFYGIAVTARKTYDYIQAMGIAQLTKHLSFSEVEKSLKRLLADSKLNGQNSFEALSLIAQLPKANRSAYASLLDFDPRIKTETGIGLNLNAYFRLLKKVVNPDGKDKSVVYGCSGADCMTVMLATDANDFTFVDLTSVSQDLLKEVQSQLNSKNLNSNFLMNFLEKESQQFLSSRSRNGGAPSIDDGNGKQKMNNLELKMLFDLKEAGVDLNKLKILHSEGAVCLEFPWKFHGASSERMRKVNLVTANITEPDTYPATLQEKLKAGIDIFYMKAATTVPQYYPQFLPHIAKSIKLGGWLMTVDKTKGMELFDPSECLKVNNLSFKIPENKEKQIFEERMHPPHDSLFQVPMLEFFSSEKRKFRVVGSDLTYWAILSLRQKV